MAAEEEGADQASQIRDLEEGNLVSLGELAVHENEEKNDNLTEAKDKAQIAATTAMLVVHMALLIEVIDKGQGNMKYYVIRLVLISMAIILQVAAGLIALVIANVRKYFRKHKEGCCAELLECCGCQSKSDEDHAKKIQNIVKEKRVDAGNGTWDILESGSKAWVARQRVSEDDERGCGGICCCNRQIQPTYEDEVLQNHDVWMELSVLAQLASVSPQKEWEACCKKIDKIMVEVQLLKARRKKLKDDEDRKKKRADLLQTINEKLVDLKSERSKKAEFHKILHNQSVFRAQGKILSKYALAVRKNRVLKCVSAWQHAINYILYGVFILNALIAGFGTLNSAQTNNDECVTQAPPNSTS